MSSGSTEKAFRFLGSKWDMYWALGTTVEEGGVKQKQRNLLINLYLSLFFVNVVDFTHHNVPTISIKTEPYLNINAASV